MQIFASHVDENFITTPNNDPIYEFSVGDVERTDTGLEVNTGYSFDHWEIFAYSWSLPAPLTLDADTTYWFSILNDTNNHGWRWSGAGEFDIPADRLPDGGWLVNGGYMLYQLMTSASRSRNPHPSRCSQLASLGSAG